MVIKCNDGFYRNFYPAEPLTRAKVHKTYIAPAYCTHCKIKFNDKPSLEQKELWRNHYCDTPNLKRWKEND